ncbi:MAG TPA: DNA polymerase III subunit alpha [Treponemataceae bacterium]|nr:DNA polymerase III subunit alpha [Treponemataceae bacterium]HQL04161.1 DNA polymerase III subunit alpha [Treponemataceae bacterium]
MSDFVHLHVHSDYSLLDGAASVKKLVSKAKELGMTALALTDHGNMFGALRFEQECRKQGLNPLVGSEFYVAGGSRLERTGTEQGNKYYHLVLIAKNEEGYRNLMILSSKAFLEGMYYKPRIDEELLQSYSGGLICLTACIAGHLPQLLLNGQKDDAEKFIQRYKNLFGEDHFYIELQDHGIPEQKRVAPMLIDIAQRNNVPMVVTNDIHYCNKQDFIAHDILLCVGTKKKRSDEKRMRFDTPEFYMKSSSEMASLFPNYPEMLSNTVKVASMCDLHIPQYKTTELPECLPVYEIPADYKDEKEFFRHLVYTGLEKRYPQITDEIKDRAEYEISTITNMGFIGYFLIVWDFIRWAKEHDIPVGPGRGSGAGSLVAYAMSITDIDPFKYKLIFERFLNPERISMPDFDVDICYEGRQEVIEYTRQKYGDEQVGQIITFGTMKAKAVIKDVARVLDIPLSDVNMITKLIPEGPKVHLKDAFEVNEKVQGSGQLAELRDDPRYKELFDISFILEDTNRNTSLHASGIVIGKTKLIDWSPMYKDSKTGKAATQYTMDIIEPCGLVKMDFLGLKTLTLIKHAEKIIRKRPGLENFSTETVSEHDGKTFDLFCAGQTAAVFQFESPGMQKVLKQALPRRIEDIVALNALYRPGPMQYIDAFIAGKNDPSTIKYPDICLKDILEETYGVIVYQEQVMQVAQRIAGYSLGQADMLRRAMGKKKAEVMVSEKITFTEGAIKQGFTKEHAEEIFDILIPFAGYGFNKSHAAAYSVVAYRTAYLKANFPAEFIAANLTNEISSTDKLPEYIAEGRSMGLIIDPPDINLSDKVFDVVDGRVKYGLLGIKGLGDAAADEIIEQRKKEGPFKNFMDFLDRVNLHTVNKRALEVLIKTGCFDSLNEIRPVLLLNMERAVEYAETKKGAGKFGQVSLFEDSGEKEFQDFVYDQLEDWPQLEKLTIEKELIGFYISGHPLDSYKKIIDGAANFRTDRISHARKDKTYTVVGLVKEVKPIFTKKEKWMAVGLIEDLYGTIKMTVFPDTWSKYKDLILQDSVLAFKAKYDDEYGGPCLTIDEVSDPQKLEPKLIQSIHIVLTRDAGDQHKLLGLRDFLFASSGNCEVYFHMETTEGTFEIKTGGNLTIPADEEFLKVLRNQPLVESVWKE